MDHKLNWIEHISYVKSKMFKGIEIIHKDIDCFFTKKVMLMLYHDCIFPYRTYCIKFWNVLQSFILFKKNHKINELPSLFSTYQSTLEKIFFYKVVLIMYKYSLNLYQNV